METDRAQEPSPADAATSGRWPFGAWAMALLGGWLAIGALASILHFILGDLPSIDLGALLLVITWTLTLAFSALHERLAMNR